MKFLTPTMVAIIILLAAAAVIVMKADAYLVRLATHAAIYSMAAVGLHLLVQMAGLPSFGHGAFLVIGAYVGGVLMLQGITDGPTLWLASLLAGLVSGAIIGALCLRTRGLYFLMATLAFAQMVQIGLRGIRSLGADDGFRLPSPPTMAAVGSIDGNAFFLIATAMLIVVILVHRAIDASRLGAVVKAARDQKRRAVALGYFVEPYLLTIFALSAGIVALAGALQGELMRYVGPGLGSWESSGRLLIMVVLGAGPGVIAPITGAIGYIVLEEVLTGMTQRWPFFLGAAILLRVLLDPAFRKWITVR